MRATSPTIAPTEPLDAVSTSAGTTHCRSMPTTLAPNVIAATKIARIKRCIGPAALSGRSFFSPAILIIAGFPLVAQAPALRLRAPAHARQTQLFGTLHPRVCSCVTRATAAPPPLTRPFFLERCRALSVAERHRPHRHMRPEDVVENQDNELRAYRSCKYVECPVQRSSSCNRPTWFSGLLAAPVSAVGLGCVTHSIQKVALAE